MHGLVVYLNGSTYAAVSQSKRKLNNWLLTFDRSGGAVFYCRFRDASGWYDGTPNAHEYILAFPKEADVLW